MIHSRTRRALIAVAAAVTPWFTGAVWAAEGCQADDFGAAVDSAGGALRAYNLDAAPRLQSRIKALAAKKGWSEQEIEDGAIVYLQDERIAKLDETSNTLLAKIDVLGRLEPGQPIDCGKLDELKTAGIELLAVMKAKTSYLISKIDAEVGPKTAAATAIGPTGAPPNDVVAPKIKDTLAPEDVPRKPAAPPVANAPVATPKPSAPANGWIAMTDPAAPGQVPAPIPSEAANQPSLPSGTPRPSVSMVAPPPSVLEADEGYTIDEIRDATRGFFGTVSTSLASVIEHAFKNTGRPTGYILGQEGGGAFLGGLRYGSGLLYVRAGGTQKIYWHGPSIGFDVGAAGARTMFLVYKMKQPEDLYRVFTGIDGSAFVVGGVGLTLLGGGGMVLAPIRSGIGMRMGANLGYLRFTPAQTWNPF